MVVFLITKYNLPLHAFQALFSAHALCALFSLWMHTLSYVRMPFFCSRNASDIVNLHIFQLDYSVSSFLTGVTAKALASLTKSFLKKIEHREPTPPKRKRMGSEELCTQRKEGTVQEKEEGTTTIEATFQAQTTMCCPMNS